MKNICVHKDNKISFLDIPKHYACVSDGKVVVIDERWITINADEEEGRKGQHVLIKENGDIVFGLGGRFKNLKDLGEKKESPFIRNYNCALAKGIGKEHYDKVRDLLENCSDENLKKLWQEKEPEVLVQDAHIKGGAFCKGRSINVNIEKDSIEEDFNKPYEATVHEIAHSIDASTYTKNGLRLSTGYKSGIFGQTIKEEINEAVNKIDKEAKIEFKQHRGDFEWLHKNGYITFGEYHSIKNGFMEPPDKYNKMMAYRKFINDIGESEPYNDTYDLRDMISGATKNKIGHGHSTSYWNKMEGRWGKSGGLALEGFAEMTSATITHTGSLKVIKKYLPRSYKIYQEMIEEAVKERKK